MITLSSRIVTRAAAAVLLLIGLFGCGDEPQVVEVLQPAEKKPVRETPSRRSAARSSASRTPVAAVPTPTPTPKPPPGALVLKATDMPNTPGTPDGEGGVMLPMNGAIELDNYEIPFPVREVIVEMKGTPANSVWPEVILSMYNRTIGKNYYAMKTYASSTEYQKFRFPQRVPLEPGTYMVTFRFLNNLDIPQTGEDRTVWLRQIELYEEPLP